MRCFDCASQFFFRDVLNRFVDCERDVRARIGGGFGAVVPAPAPVSHHHHLARPPSNLLIERVFDSAEAFFVDIHVAEDGRSQFPLRIHAMIFFLEEDAAQVHVADSFDDVGRKFFCEADGRVGFADFRFDVVCGESEDAG